MKIKSLYLASHEPSAGSIVISIGMMELLKAKFHRVAFFRPFVKNKVSDHDILFFLNRYKLGMRYEQTYGFSVNEVENFIAKNRLDELIKALIVQFKTLEERYDFVFVEGLNQSHFSKTIELDINLEIAKNFGIPYINVLKGNGKKVEEIIDDILIDHEKIKALGMTHFATFVNRLVPHTKEALQQQLKNYPDLPMSYLLDEISELNQPTIHEVKTALKCQVIQAQPRDFRRVVKNMKVAAMQLENYLEYLEEGDLILVPGDRADIVAGSLLAIYSKKYPNISGIVLTGGLSLAHSILKILQGFKDFPIPIFSTNDDTYQTAINVHRIIPALNAKNERKIALALGAFSKAINRQCIQEKLLEPSSPVITPAMFEYGLFQKAMRHKKRIVLPEALDSRILQATEILLRRDIVEIILLGNPEEILHKSGTLGLDIAKATIINPRTFSERERFVDVFYHLRKAKGMTLGMAQDLVCSLSYFGTMMVYLGLADGMVAGATHTTQETIRPALQIIKTKPDIPIVSSLFFMSMETQVLVYADCAINQDPTAEELAVIAITTADTAVKFGITPKIAMLSYSTGTSGKGEDVDKVAHATQIVKAKRPDLLIEGPIQYDAAIDKQVAQTKIPDSPVAGEATIFIFPDLNTGNNTYKAVQRSSGAVAIGPVLQGLKKPINDLSRGCLVSDIVNTVAITAIQASENELKENA